MGDIYKKSFVDSASIFDKQVKANGSIVELVSEITDTGDCHAVIELCEKLYIASESDDRETVKDALVLKDWLVRYYGHQKVVEICREGLDSKTEKDNRTLEELLAELDGLVGLKRVKEQVNDLIAYQRVKKLREEEGFFSEKSTLHMAFTGNPGTGKTTVARIVGHIYKQIGLLSKGTFMEVSRTDLIAGYQGQTALKVKDVIEKAKGGVLFIDEAYSITENDHSDSYGRECLTELTKALEDYRDDLVVIVAGYSDPMKQFFESNPGLKSRFNIFIEFDDYTADELVEIFKSLCKKNDYTLSVEAEEAITSKIKIETDNKRENFANGRLVRNMFEEYVIRHARRVSHISRPTRIQLEEITLIDIEDY